jgi:multiple sugar transport system permease protein/raffinose/stachyose/melibiose transport system permease protein
VSVRFGSRGITYAVLALLTVILLYPFYFMVRTAFQSIDQFQRGSGFSLVSWHDLFDQLPVWRELFNSTLISVSAVAIILLVSTMAGYAFGILRYRASTVVFLLVVGAMLVPMPSIIVPEYINLANWGRINHYDSAIVVYAALGAPFSTFLMTTYMRRLPFDVIEAALMDGLSYARVFLRIIVPLARPAMVTIAVLQFIQVWDDLLVGLLMLQTPDKRPITVGLATIPSQHGLDVPLLMAGSLVSALPAVIVYLIFQRYLISGLTLGMGK